MTEKCNYPEPYTCDKCQKNPKVTIEPSLVDRLDTTDNFYLRNIEVVWGLPKDLGQGRSMIWFMSLWTLIDILGTRILV